VAKTVNGVTTKYLVDTNNFTGYAQVVEELVNDEVQRQYSYGLDLISERQVIDSQIVSDQLVDNQATNNEREVSFYGYDGHGSVRYLSDLSGKVTDTYNYDAYGILLEQTGSTPNLYRYAGEQWDADLGLYYNRARYLDVDRGRFWTSDSFEGEIEEPLSLHKYLYGNANPVGNVDPSGNATLVSQVLTQLGYLSTAYSAFGFLRNPSIETASVLALDLAIPGLARGIKTLRDSGRVFAALQKAKFVNDNEVNSFKTLSEFGYKLLMTEKALQIINNGLSNGGKLLEGIFANTSGKLSLVEAKTTLSIFHINESIEKSVQVVKRLEDVVASGAPSGVSTSGSISSLVDEIIITYNKIGKLTVGSSSYTLGQGEKILDGGLTVKELFVEGKRVVVNISGKEVPVYVKQVL
jgi:RHS repeat-associated protein